MKHSVGAGRRRGRGGYYQDLPLTALPIWTTEDLLEKKRKLFYSVLHVTIRMFMFASDSTFPDIEVHARGYAGIVDYLER